MANAGECDRISAKRLFYLRMPVFAFTAKSRALKSAGDSWPRSGHDRICLGWNYEEIMQDILVRE